MKGDKGVLNQTNVLTIFRGEVSQPHLFQKKCPRRSCGGYVWRVRQCVCVCMCMRVCVVVSSRGWTQVCVWVHIHSKKTYMCVRTCTHTHKCMYVCKQTHIHICLGSPRPEGAVVLTHSDSTWALTAHSCNHWCCRRFQTPSPLPPHSPPFLSPHRTAAVELDAVTVPDAVPLVLWSQPVPARLSVLPLSHWVLDL